jgi:hypothetical protein
MTSRGGQIRIEGAQREQIDADLTAQLVVLLGRQLAAEADGHAPGDGTVMPADTEDGP